MVMRLWVLFKSMEILKYSFYQSNKLVGSREPSGVLSLPYSKPCAAIEISLTCTIQWPFQDLGRNPPHRSALKTCEMLVRIKFICEEFMGLEVQNTFMGCFLDLLPFCHLHHTCQFPEAPFMVFWAFICLLCHILLAMYPYPGPEVRGTERKISRRVPHPPSWDHSSSHLRGRTPLQRFKVPAGHKGSREQKKENKNIIKTDFSTLPIYWETIFLLLVLEIKGFLWKYFCLCHWVSGHLEFK